MLRIYNMRYTTALSVIYLLLHICGMSNVAGVVTVTTSAVTGIPNQQALTLRCRYTTDEVITGYRWSRKTGSTYTQILSGSVSPQAASFQDTWENKGAFRGDYTSTLDIELPANHVTSSYAGTYRCTVLGISNTEMGDVTATVLSAPTVSGIPSPNRVNEFSNLRIDCSTYTVANPSVTGYTWIHKGSTVSSGAVLDISSISRNQAGQYTCTATNTQGSDSESVVVDVQYGPGSSVAVSPQGSLERVEGSGPFTATCTAVCNPSCSISWRKGSTNLPPGQLSISNISTTDQGDYTCQAQNGIGGPGQKTLTLTVYYLREIRLTLDRSDVTENDTVNLNCSVDSNPTVQMTIKNIDNDTVVVQRNTNTLTYTIQRVQCLHNGMFVCSVDNQKTEGISSGSNTLNVQCNPRHDFRKPFHKVVSQNVGKTARIVADVIANPDPTFTWYRLEGDSESPISSETVHSVTSTSHQSVLEINITRTQDYGDYVVKVQNTIGSTRLQFILTATRPPSIPENFKMLTAPRDTAVSFSWTSGFNGGGEQTFTLEYRADTESQWTTWKEGIPDPGLNKEVIENVKGLAPVTKYSFQVYGVNQYGVGDSDVVSVITTEPITETTGNSLELTSAGVAGWVVAAVLLVIIIVVIFLLYKRGVFKTKDQQQETNRRGEVSRQARGNVNFSTDVVPESDQPKNTYSDLHHSDRDKQTYTELRTYQNIQTNAADATSVYEGMQEASLPAYEKISEQKYENNPVNRKDQLYENTRKI